MFIKTEDPDLPAFYFDPLINPIAHRHSVKVSLVSHKTKCDKQGNISGSIIHRVSPPPITGYHLKYIKYK